MLDLLTTGESAMAVQIFKNAQDVPPPPGGLQFFETKELISRFGFKAVEIDGTWFWEPGTEDDYRKSEAERRGIKKEDVDIMMGCYQTGPRSCGGICSSGFCTLMYNPSGNYYYCSCS
jgi:hypothetical protein